MSSYATIDMSKLPRPTTYSATHEALLAARMDYLVARLQAAGVAYDVGSLETDPAKILQEADAYREMLNLQAIDDAVMQRSLAYSSGDNLDVVAADYMTVRAVGESDASLRARAQLSWEALSRGGSYGGYEYEARTAAPLELSDVAVYGHEVDGVARGEVRIVCLGATASGVPSAAVLQRVRERFPRDKRKVNDFVTVVAATPAVYTIDATLTLREGADAATVVAAQVLRLDAYCLARRALTESVTLGGVVAALGHDDAGFVVDVALRAPLAKIGGSAFEAPVCVGRRVVWEIAA